MSGSNGERMSVRYMLEAAQQLKVSFWGGQIIMQGQMWIGQVSHTVGWPTAGG
jgi:hypothetical protein